MEAKDEKAEAARARLQAGGYVPWDQAGGPEECAHGYAEGLACPECDRETVRAMGSRYHEPSATELVAVVLGSHPTDDTRVFPSLDLLETVAGLEEGEGWPVLLALARKGAVAAQKQITSSGRSQVERWSTPTDSPQPASIHAALACLERAKGSRIFGPVSEPPRVTASSNGEGLFRVVDHGSEDFMLGELVDYPEGHNAAACSCEECHDWRAKKRVRAPNLGAEGLHLEATVERVREILGRYPRPGQ